MDRVRVERQVKLALALGVVHDGAVVAVDGIELVRIEVGEQTAGLVDVEIPEERVDMIVVGVEGGGDEILAGDLPLQVESEPPLGEQIVLVFDAGRFDQPVPFELSDHPVGERQEEELIGNHLDLSLDAARASLRIRDLDDHAAGTLRQLDGPSKSAVGEDADRLPVHLDVAPGIGPPREAESGRGEARSGQGEVDGKVRDRLLGDNNEAVVIVIGDVNRQARDPNVAVLPAYEQPEHVLTEIEIQILRERAVGCHLERFAVELNPVAGFGRPLETADGDRRARH